MDHYLRGSGGRIAQAMRTCEVHGITLHRFLISGPEAGNAFCLKCGRRKPEASLELFGIDAEPA